MKNKCFLYFVVLLIIILLASGIIYYKMPKRYCHKEANVYSIKVGCEFPRFIPANAERICEDGVDGSVNNIDYANIVWYCGSELYDTKECFIREWKEVCEIK